MFLSKRTYLAPATVEKLTEAQIKQVYKSRTKNWARGMGFGSNVRAYLESGGASWEEFYQDFKNHKFPIQASELPEVYADEQAALAGEMSTAI